MHVTSAWQNLLGSVISRHVHNSYCRLQYDDEYDDTYDHLGAAGPDADSADELSMPDNRKLPWVKDRGYNADGNDDVCEVMVSTRYKKVFAKAKRALHPNQKP